MYEEEYEEEYAEAGAEFGGLFGSIGHFVGNAAKVAGREIGRAATSVQKAGGKVGDAVGKIPVVGAPVHTVLSAAYHAAAAPVKLTVDVAIKHRRLDKALLSRLHEQVADVKAVAPYAQMVLSTVPGIGTAASGAIGAGVALAQGQPIDKALIAGVVAAIPGGPAVKAAANLAAHGIDSAARGEKIDMTGVGPLMSQLNIPDKGKEALIRGLQATADIASGKKADAALADSLLKEGMKYLPPDAKKAFQTVAGVASGAVMQQVKGAHLPAIHGKLLESGLQLSKTLPAIGEARKLAGKGTKGFDLAQGLLSQKASVFDIAHTRKGITASADQMGFDMAVATRIGLVSHPPKKELSHAAAAGRAITNGMQSMQNPKHKKILMKHVEASPSASVGAKFAIKKIAEQRQPWPVRVVRTVKAGFKQLMSGHT